MRFAVYLFQYTSLGGGVRLVNSNYVIGLKNYHRRQLFSLFLQTIFKLFARNFLGL